MLICNRRIDFKRSADAHKIHFNARFCRFASKSEYHLWEVEKVLISALETHTKDRLFIWDAHIQIYFFVYEPE